LSAWVEHEVLEEGVVGHIVRPRHHHQQQLQAQVLHNEKNIQKILKIQTVDFLVRQLKNKTEEKNRLIKEP